MQCRRQRSPELGEILRILALSLAIAALCLPAVAGEPYKPAKLKPAELVAPSEDLIAAARALLAAVEKGDGDAIDAAIAPKVTAIDGALNLDVKRHVEIIGPTKTIESMLVQLASFIGGIYETPADGGDATPYAIEAERRYIVSSLTEEGQWGTDPLLKGAVCTYAYRSFDRNEVKALGEKLKTATSSFFYVNGPSQVLAAPAAKAAVVATLEPDLLYGQDYDTDAPGRWMAVHLPDGGSGFINFDKVEMEKPYAAGICFTKGKDGAWLMSAQVSTSL